MSSEFLTVLRETYWGPYEQLQWVMFVDRMKNLVGSSRRSAQSDHRRNSERTPEVEQDPEDFECVESEGCFQSSSFSAIQGKASLGLRGEPAALSFTSEERVPGAAFPGASPPSQRSLARALSWELSEADEIEATGHDIPEEHRRRYRARELQRRQEAEGHASLNQWVRNAQQ